MNRILVVDDDKTTRLVLSKVLTSAGALTSVAKDGVEALKASVRTGSTSCCWTSGCPHERPRTALEAA
jgi:DNA-binding NtrC family response regulator